VRRARPPLTYTESLKRRLMNAYGDEGRSTSAFEFDHLVPIALGGAPRTIANLWPEPSGGADGYQAKDRVEAALARAACRGAVPLAVAQAAIADDWRTALARLHLQRFATPESASAAEAQ
jgi:hypothetical protein